MPIGYSTSKPFVKNKVAEMFYRRAIDVEFKRFYEAVMKATKRDYTIVKVDNALPSKRLKSKRMTSIRAKKKIDQTINRLSRIFLKNTVKITRKWLNKLKDSSERHLRDNLARGLTPEQFTVSFNSNFKKEYELALIDNAKLIKNVSSQFETSISTIVSDSMLTGKGWNEVQAELLKEAGVNTKRLKFIARDQTAKATQTINELSQKSLGIRYWQWQTVQDRRVSTGKGGHKQLNGKIYRYDKPEDDPIIDWYGHRGKPSVRPNCRCTALAVFIHKGYKPERQPDGSYKIVKI